MALLLEKLMVVLFRVVRKIAKSHHSLRHVCLYVCLSVWNNSVPKGRILIKLDISALFENVSRKVTIKMQQE